MSRKKASEFARLEALNNSSNVTREVQEEIEAALFLPKKWVE
ncbi:MULTISPECIES: hypothetical protein [unclassified Coleofasciculus]|nr:MULTISPECIES: hypothetical protein [unclassified Coleofasciculus]